MKFYAVRLMPYLLGCYGIQAMITGEEGIFVCAVVLLISGVWLYLRHADRKTPAWKKLIASRAEDAQNSEEILEAEALLAENVR